MKYGISEAFGGEEEKRRQRNTRRLGSAQVSADSDARHGAAEPHARKLCHHLRPASLARHPDRALAPNVDTFFTRATADDRRRYTKAN